MLSYKRKEDPLLQKILKSGLFQFAIVVLLGISVTYFVIQSDRPQQWIQKINRFTSVSPNISQRESIETEAGIAEDSAELEDESPAMTWAARPPTAASATETAPTTTTGVTAAVSAVLLTVRMVEIDHNYLVALANSPYTEQSNINGDIKAMRLVAETVIDNSSLRQLKADRLDFSENKDSSINAGTTRGLRLAISPINTQGQIKLFDLRFIKNHPNDTQQIPFDLSLRRNEKFILSGSSLISYFELEPDLADTPPFQIFKSTDYRDQKTTFAIIIELQ